jgi:hypothetical protein
MSLQFHLQPRYFWVMPKNASGWAMAALLMAACGERERLTFPSSGDGIGPVTEILTPAFDDSIIHEGDPFVLSGRASDFDGVDSVYFDIEGVPQESPPLKASGADTTFFGVPISTSGRSGATVAVRIYAVDLLGQQGDPVSRQFRIE